MTSIVPDFNLGAPASKCPVCGATGTERQRVLWPGLIAEWQLSPGEAAYVDDQQGKSCSSCRSNLRSMALAKALIAALGGKGLLSDVVDDPRFAAIRILEVNEAGTLTPWLKRFPGHQLVAYPETDMHSLPFRDGSYDIVVHSDTLEHISNPVHALGECRRVLRGGGHLCFTVPVIIGRLTRDRAGLPKSFHGYDGCTDEGFVVQTEYGADAWTQIAAAGFESVTLVWQDYPSALAMIASKG